MSGGTNASTQYPASILSGLWTDVNNAYSGTYGNTSANTGSSNNSYGLTSNYMNNSGAQETFGGYNPSNTAQQSNTSVSNSSNLSNLGSSGYNNLTNSGQNTYNNLTNSGQNTYNTVAGAGSTANAQATNTYNQTGSSASGLQNAYNNNIGAALTSYLSGANNSYGSNNSYAQQALTNAFDPQKALYAQQYGLQQQQDLASQAQSGTATSPYGAGLTEQGNQNFDIAWQAQQLKNQQTGAGTAASLYGANANTANTASNMLNQVSGTAGNLYNTANSAVGTGSNALTNAYSTGSNALNNAYSTGSNALNSGYSTAVSDAANASNAGSNALSTGASTGLNQNQYSQQQIQTQIGDYLQYLGVSTSDASSWANAVANMYSAATGQYSAANQAQGNQAKLNAEGLSGLGSGLGTLAGLFAGS